MNNEKIQSEIMLLIAKDRIEIPLSSMYQKIKRTKKKDAEGLAGKLVDSFDSSFEGERAFAYVANEDKDKARGMKEAIAEFAAEFPKYGAILVGKIAEKRTLTEQHLYFGVNTGSRLTTEDYIGVMQTLGMSENSAKNLYPDLLKISRKLENSREDDRSIIIGKYNSQDSE